VICPRRLHLDGMPAPCRSRGQRHHPGRRQSQDACGGELLRREDDIEEALAVRFREYHAKTNPVLDIFRGKEYVITVDSRPPREQVQQAIRDKLGLPPSRLAAASSQVGAR
jgi:adenylate kinase family enzyme